MRKLEFSGRSLKEIRNTVDYLKVKWSERISDNFLKELKRNIDLIQINPELFPISEFEGLRKCVVSKQTSVFFIIKNNIVYIVSVFDTRQNPNKIKE
ncbi:type II toxin-antitoxin system RelE/ParE family toxin [Flavobacterium sp.]|jgi:plasmid stabilization system protein ParE|uniref:type II toxin-antitoxin system RelE/ParE family toxin n=1 Tax=Flavobacterium sp. TaxID=239 RepID=UPI001B6F968F|nr:type II toxin-antitoxin system RelE/ParE family toxin [Flavobacterium sp.]MBP6127124.1 type II toxin-antitoxin system RelE/ParE family toxin [Flavobacterium sp.]